MKYNPKKIEKKWQDYWKKEAFYKAEDSSKKKKIYILIEFPYPSGQGLHTGHCRSYSALDAVARKRRMQGLNVLYPIGWDAFGLPTENYAIKTGIHPQVATEKNVANFKRQLKSMGFSFDWSREINTTDPKYYKWTQWIFLKLFENNLAYQAKIPINWCPSCKIGLANEEVIDGKCERCGAQVTKKELKQWMLKITKYADRLVDDLEKVNYLEKIKAQQIDWIGRSYGTEIDFKVESSKDVISVFTTRTDTTFGVTAIVLAPEHSLVEKLTTKEHSVEVKRYIEEAREKTEFERTKLEKEKTGVFTGSFCINPLNNEKIPIWVGDYVVATYGGGAVMVVPAHDKRDYDFAKKYGLEIREVVSGGDISKESFVEYGTLVNSGQFNGLSSEKAIEKITQWLEKRNLGRKKVHYKLRDWVFSRQHYWGEPIPIIHCENCAKKDKKTILLIHGTNKNGRADWFGWLSDKLRQLGHEVIAPDMPNSDRPVLEEWMAELKKYQDRFHENTIIIGHSLGGMTALQLVSQLKQKIDKLILVTPIPPAKVMDWKKFAKKHPDDPVDHQKKFSDIDINFNDLEKNTQRTVYFYSDNDSYIQDSGNNYFKKNLKAEFKLLRGRSHFTINNGGVSTFPEIFKEIIEENPLPVGVIPVPEKDLPIELPYVKKYQPTDTGESPLAAISDWINTKCPKCKGKAKRETDTMPNWAGSNWYFIRYVDPNNNKALADSEKIKYWLPVDWYNGGMEHTTLHLLYSRFIYKFLYDIKVVPSAEPYQKRTSHGIVLAEDGRKMSKSLGNVVNPDDIIKQYGADTLRMYEMFMGPFDQTIAWSTDGVKGVFRSLNKFWDLILGSLNNKKSSPEAIRKVHQLNKKVAEDIDTTKFNTAIAAFMEFVNFAREDQKEIGQDIIERILILLAPFAPHLTEELWHYIGHKDSVHNQAWPEYDKNLIKEEVITLVIQINGRVRDKIEVEADITEDKAKNLTLNREKIKKILDKKQIKKVVFIKNKLINIVI